MKRRLVTIVFMLSALPQTALADPVDAGLKQCPRGEQGVVVYQNNPYTGETSVVACTKK